jgi:hypothetical protein
LVDFIMQRLCGLSLAHFVKIAHLPNGPGRGGILLREGGLKLDAARPISRPASLATCSLISSNSTCASGGSPAPFGQQLKIGTRRGKVRQALPSPDNLRGASPG